MKAGIPQQSVLRPILYLLYTSVLLELEDDTEVTLADDTAIVIVGESNEEAASKLQTAVNLIQDWTKR